MVDTTAARHQFEQTMSAFKPAKGRVRSKAEVEQVWRYAENGHIAVKTMADTAEWFDHFHDDLIADKYSYPHDDEHDDQCAICGLRSDLRKAIAAMEGTSNV